MRLACAGAHPVSAQKLYTKWIQKCKTRAIFVRAVCNQFSELCAQLQGLNGAHPTLQLGLLRRRHSHSAHSCEVRNCLPKKLYTHTVYKCDKEIGDQQPSSNNFHSKNRYRILSSQLHAHSAHGFHNTLHRIGHPRSVRCAAYDAVQGVRAQVPGPGTGRHPCVG